MSELSFFKAAKTGENQTLDHEVNADNINNRDSEKGYTALCYAAGFNQKSSVALLLQRGAAINKPGGELNQTPLMLAAARGFNDIVLLLLEATGVDVDAADANGNNALMLAVLAGHIPVINTLITKTKLNHLNTSGDSVFYLSDHARVNDVLVSYLSPAYSR